MGSVHGLAQIQGPDLVDVIFIRLCRAEVANLVTRDGYLMPHLISCLMPFMLGSVRGRGPTKRIALGLLQLAHPSRHSSTAETERHSGRWLGDERSAHVWVEALSEP